MHIHIVPNRGSPPTVLLRESFREGSKVGKRTLANLSSLSAAQIEAMRAALRGEVLAPLEQAFEITASRSHGHVQAVALTMQRLGLASLLGPSCHERDRVLAMIASRIVAPHTKLATTRWWHTTTLAEDFGVADTDEDDLYAAMDWLLARVAPASVAATPDIASYVEAVLGLYIAFAAAFQVPIVVILLVKVGLVSIKQLTDFRGYFIVVSFIIAAVITPPDVISQLALAIPMCLLYEVGIWSAQLFIKHTKAPEAEGEKVS